MADADDGLATGLHDLVAQVPDVLQPLIIAAGGAVPFIEGEGAAAVGVLAGLNPVLAAVSAATGNFVCVVLVVLLGARIRAALVARRTRRAPAALVPAGGGTPEVAPAKPESKGRLKIRRWLVRFGVPGASLLAPIALPTPFTAATLVAAGVGKGWVILWQGIAIAVWTTAVTIAATLLVTAVTS